MSEPKRYSNLDIWKALHFGEGDEGWVKWEDYARLKAEVERLQSIHSIDSIGIEQLKAEVERLTSDLQMEKENEDRLVREWQRANNEVYGLQRQVAALIDDQTRLKAEVERLTKAVKCGFHGGDQLLGDLNRLLTAHRHYCWVNAIDCTQMEKDALNAAKEGKGQP